MASTIEGEWQDLAIDQGDEILEQNEYYATIDDNDANNNDTPFSTRITNISYSPAVNKVKNLSIDVPPSSLLEGDKYLGETVQVFVKANTLELLFEGKIINISTSQVTGEDYSIEAEPPAKNLKGNSIDRDFINYLNADALKNIVDESADVSMAMRGVRELVNQDYEDKTIVGAEEDLTDVVHVGGNALKAQTSNAQVRHNYNGSISSMERLVVKAYTPSSTSISLTVRGDNSNVDGESSFDAHNFTLSGLNKNKYGEWTEFTIDTNTDSFAYDLIFDMDEDCVLMDWVMIRDDNEFTTNLTTPALTTNTNQKSYSVSPTDEDVLDSVGSMFIADKDAGTIRPRQVSVWNRLRYIKGKFDDLYVKDSEGRHLVPEKNRVSLIPSPDIIVDLTFVEDGGFLIAPGEQTPNLAQEDAKSIWNGSSDTSFDDSLVYDDMSNIQIHVRVQILSDEHKPVPFERFSVNWSGDRYNYSKVSNKQISTQEPTWVTFNTEKEFNITKREEETNDSRPFHVTDLIDSLTLSNVSRDDDEIIYENIDVDDDGEKEDWESVSQGQSFIIDAIVLSHSPSVEESLNLSFDRSQSKVISNPKKFASPEHYDTEYFRDNSSFEKETTVEYVQSVQNSIDEASLSTDLDGDFNGTGMSGYRPGVSVSNDDRTGQGFTGLKFYNAQRNFEVPGKVFRFQFRPMTHGNTSDFTPQLGYDREVHSSDFDFDITFNDANVVSSKSVQDNRLGAMNNFSSDSGVYFRWDNNTCEIFERGDRKNSVNLYNEKINSSIDISETYNSCIVKGKYGVKSDEIIASQSPSFVDKKKFIRDRDIEDEGEANAKAREFIRNHSDIEYSGKIDTLPTLAPVGEMMDGGLFNHGQDMVIKSVSYSKNSASIDLGLTNRFASQVISMSETMDLVDSSVTRSGIDIPVGENKVRSDDRRGSDL